MTGAPDDEEIERAIVRVADLLYVVRSNLQHGEKFASPDPEWLPAVVRGRLREQLALVMLTPVPGGDPVTVQLLRGASGLPARWPRLDQFEGSSYKRILVAVEARQGQVVVANLYAARF
jgi:hypothetical protein